MNESIKNFILEGEKEFEEKINKFPHWGDEVYSPGDEEFIVELNSVGVEELKQFISSRQISLIKMIVESIKLPEYDHSKCPIKETCIGYQNAESDLENIKAELLSELTDGK